MPQSVLLFGVMEMATLFGQSQKYCTLYKQAFLCFREEKSNGDGINSYAWVNYEQCETWSKITQVSIVNDPGIDI